MAQNASSEHVEILTGPLKGVNSRTLSSKLGAGWFAKLRNLDFRGDHGGYVICPGSRRLNPAVLAGDTPILGLHRWYKGLLGTTPETLVAHGTKLYTMSAAGTFTDTGGTFTAGAKWFFADYADASTAKYVFSANGVNAPRRWDGTTLRTMGFPAPTTGGMSATPGAAGVLTGAYFYSVSCVFDSVTAHESTATPASGTTATAQKIELTGIPTGGTGCTSRRLYRTKAGGNLYFFLATISDNVTTTYSDNIADADLGAAQAPGDNGVPPSDLMLLMVKKDRAAGVSAATPNIVRFSAVTTTERSLLGGASVHGAGPEIWPTNHFVPVGDDGLPVVALEWFRGSWVFFQHNRIHTFRGVTASDMDLDDVESLTGCAAPRSVVNCGTRHGILFLGISKGVPGVYRFNGASAECISEEIEGDLKARCIGVSTACATRIGDLYRICYATNAGGTAFEIAEFDLKLKRWQFRDCPGGAAMFSRWDGPTDDGRLVYGHARAGWVVQMDIGRGFFNHDAPTEPIAVTMEIESGWIDADSINAVKQLRFVDAVGEAQDEAEVDLSRAFNFDESPAAVTSQDGGPDSEGDPLTMEARVGQAWHKRVDCGHEGTGIPEQGLVLRLNAKVTVPTSSEGDEYARAAIHEFRLVYSEAPPVSLEQERKESLLEEIE